MANKNKTPETPMASLIFVQRQSNNPKLVAEAEIVFGAGAGFLAGMKVTGIAIWTSDRTSGGLTVTLPAKKTDKRYYDFLMPAQGGNGLRKAFTDHVLAEWRAIDASAAAAQ